MGDGTTYTEKVASVGRQAFHFWLMAPLGLLQGWLLMKGKEHAIAKLLCAVAIFLAVVIETVCKIVRYGNAAKLHYTFFWYAVLLSVVNVIGHILPLRKQRAADRTE